jgi:hypothetical protein
VEDLQRSIQGAKINLILWVYTLLKCLVGI